MTATRTTAAPDGFYLMKYGGGRYGSVGWCATMQQAEAWRTGVMERGSWQGMPPKIQPSYPHETVSRRT